MDWIMEWIRKNKKKTFFIIILLVFLPMVSIHFLFKFYTHCYWVEAEWGAGEILGYFGDVLSFIATVILGYATLRINDKANKQNDKLIQMQNNQEKSIAIIDQDNKLNFFIKNQDPILIERLKKDGVDFNIDYVDDTLNTDDIMIMEFRFKNITNNFITGLEINKFDIIIDEEEDWVVEPCNGLDDEISVFIDERNTQKARFILTGLKSVLSEEQWNGMQNEFEIKCILTSQNIFNQKTSICLETGATIVGADEKTGKRTYKIFNYQYKEIKS